MSVRNHTVRSVVPYLIIKEWLKKSWCWASSSVCLSFIWSYWIKAVYTSFAYWQQNQTIVRWVFFNKHHTKGSHLNLTIIPRARMGSESIAREAKIACEAKGWMGFWLRGHEGERNNCFSKIQLVGQKYRDKTTLSSKTRFSRHCFGFQSWCFSLLVGYNI